MKNPTSNWRWLLAAVATICLLLSGLFTAQTGIRPQTHAATSPEEIEFPHAVSAAKPAEPPDLIESPQLQGFTLALDEYVLHDAEGRDVAKPLNPPATRETLWQRIKEASGSGAAFPVLYPEGRERTALRRKLITSEITIRLPSGASPEQVAKETALRLRVVPDYAPGYAVYSADNPMAALGKATELQKKNIYPLVEVMLASRHTKRTMPNDTQITNQWHLKYTGLSNTLTGCDVNIENAWLYGGTDGVKGTGIRIGIIDDGLETAHPDFAGNIDTTNDKDWNGNDLDPNPSTGDDHGTSCAGVAAARGNNSLGVCGTAPEATLVGLRLTSDAYTATDAEEAEAMSHRNDIIQVKSNSWGPTDDGLTLEAPGALTLAAFQTATTSGRNNKGTIFLWAGGNGLAELDNSNYDGYANSIYTIAIGAMDSRLRQADYSEPGANLVVVVPSDGPTASTRSITTTDRTSTLGYNTSAGTAGNYTGDFGGTSSATPAAAGIVALMLQKNPNLGWRDVQEILIQSATKINASDTGWANNSAGFHFHHAFGAGLINATAAVNMAATWVNRPARTTQTVTQSGLAVTIPDNNSTGITRTFNVPNVMRVEQVTVKVNINHAWRGDLAVTLTSPSGMASTLTTLNTSNDSANYSNWTFSSVRQWGELAKGNWTLKIADRSAGITGNLTFAELTVHGTDNPPPVPSFANPANNATVPHGQFFAITGTATDTNALFATGTITKLELLRDGLLVSTDNTAPYSFNRSEALGTYNYTLRATDADGAVGVSSPLTITVDTPYNIWIAGFPGIANNSPTSDPDGDGYTNEQEFAASTNPTLASSALRITSFAPSIGSGSVSLTWQSVSGVGYIIQGSPNLQSWTNLGATVIATGASTTTSRPYTTGAKYYFRVRTFP